MKDLNVALVTLTVTLALSTPAAAQSVKERLAIQTVEADVARTLLNHVNTEHGVNGYICEPAESLSTNRCKGLPKSEWATITATIDWDSILKNRGERTFEEIADRCSQLAMGVAEASEGRNPAGNVVQKAIRDQVKTVRCWYDAKAGEQPTLKLKDGVLSLGFSWATGEQKQVRYMAAKILLDIL